jgi:hypothetical protein
MLAQSNVKLLLAYIFYFWFSKAGNKYYLIILLASRKIVFSLEDAYDATTCVSVLQGVVDGGRCFFPVVNVTVSWDDAWSVCKQYGADLAQIHTSHELTSIIGVIMVSRL